MKLDEIIKIPAQTDRGYKLSDFDEGEKVATYEGFPIYCSKAIVNSKAVLYELRSKDDITIVLSELVGEHIDFEGSSYFVVGRTWVDIENRRKGYISALYLALVNKLHFTLMSDIEHSPESIEVWKKLSKSHRVKIQILNSKDNSRHDEIDWDKVYASKDLRLIATKNPSHPQFSEGILQEYIVITHEENFGQYE